MAAQQFYFKTAAGGVRAIVLSTISKYLQGTIGVTGIVASLLEF